MTDPQAAPDAHAASLNEDQARKVTSTFGYVDQLLRDIERLAHMRTSPFDREVRDISDTEADLLLAFAQRARERMLATLDHLHLARPRATLSARWTALTALRFVDSALSELTTATLRGYGQIEPSAGSEVTAVAAALRGLVARGINLLQPREGEKLRERLAELGGPLGEILRGAEALSTARGLVEVRPLLAAAAERAQATTIDVGIFGRVSSGKSSLINALIGVPLLPVGATPVTAVPLRVTHGPAEIRILGRDGREEVVEPERLADLATEAGNPDNIRGVRFIVVHTPAMPAGLALLDTPGVGSLSQSGPAQAFAWLPRCDLGLVLVAAGTPVGGDELALVAGLTQAGIAVEVLLSKSDLVPAPERESALEYVQGEIARATRTTDMVVRPVSVAPSEIALLDDWRRNVLMPNVASRQRVAELSLGRRVRALIASLNAALARRPGLERAAIDLQRARLEATTRITAIVDELQDSTDAALSRATAATVRAWKAGTDARAAARHELLDAPQRALTDARAAADSVLPHSDDDDAESGARIPPLFDPPLLDAIPIAPQAGALDHLFGAAAARRHLASSAKELDSAYSLYANRLRAWAMERLKENVERNVSSTAGESGPLAAELRPLAELVEQHFSTSALPHPERR